MRPGRTWVFLVAALLLGALPGGAWGQANCALRTPDRQIYEIFPKATSYRTVEAEVNATTRATLEREIGSSLAPTDLGIHSAYVVLDGAVPIGFIHARTEIGSRGSIELVWAMDIDLTLTDFRVQRSRERHTEAIQSASFRDELVGRNLADLRDLLTSGNDAVDLASLHVPAAAASIAHTTVLCALKTRVITDIAFSKTVAPAQQLAHIHRDLTGVEKVTKVMTPLSSETRAAIDRGLGRAPNQVDLTSIDILRARGAGGSEIGFLIRVNWRADPRKPETWWAVESDGTLRRASIGGRAYTAVRREFQRLQGSGLDGVADGDTVDKGPSARRLAREVLAIAAALRGPG